MNVFWSGHKNCEYTPIHLTKYFIYSEEISYSKSLPEGLNKETESHVIKDRQSPRGSITAQSVPDLLIHPAQESLHDSSSPKRERQMKPSISLTRAMSLKASLMKNAIIGGWKRKGIVCNQVALKLQTDMIATSLFTSCWQIVFALLAQVLGMT